MEKYFRSIKTIFSLLIFLLPSLLFGQTPSVVRTIRVPLWAELEVYPGLEEENDSETGRYAYPQKKIKEVAPFIVNGMVYGWSFSYTPSDKARGVEEYLEVTEIVSSDVIQEGIKYTSPWIEDNKLNYWCEYNRTASQIQNYELWSSINNPKIHGRGYGRLVDGFDGIKDAAEDALKEAVRNYYRNVIKNKPKEITGKVLIRDLPTLGIASGRYVINLDFFLECGKILEYTVF